MTAALQRAFLALKRACVALKRALAAALHKGLVKFTEVASGVKKGELLSFNFICQNIHGISM